ncbi:MAG: OmpA family protein [Bacteroidales bacterium]
MKNLYFLFIIVMSISIGKLSAQQESVPFDKDAFPENRKGLRQAKKNIRKGDRLFNAGIGNYKQALDHYSKAREFNPENALVNYKIGICHFKTNNKEKAGKYLKKAYRLDSNVVEEIAYVLGQYYHFHAELDKAIDFFQTYRNTLSPEKLQEEREILDKRVKECEFAKHQIENPERVFIENPGSRVNSEYPDYSPVVNADETILFFTSRRPGEESAENFEQEFGYYENIYVTEKNEQGEWGEARKLDEPVNSDDHDAVVGITPDARQLLVYRSKKGGRLYNSTLEEEQWTKLEKLSAKINTKYHEPSASFSKDGQTLIYVSDKPGGYGKHDIYMSKMNENGKWEEGKNLDTVVNTPYDETGVFMHPDGKTIYFSSKGHNTMGGYDVFKTELSEGEWTEPENLGYPINTTGDDVFISLSEDRKYAYMSSERPEGKGSQDIYRITFLGDEKKLINTSEDQWIAFDGKEVPNVNIEDAIEVESPELTLMKGKISDKESGEPLEATINLTDNATNENVANFSSNEQTGKYMVTLPAGKNYGIAVRAEGYLFYSENIDLTDKQGYEELEKNIELEKIEVGKSIVLRNIFFDTDKSSLRDESQGELDRLYDILNKNPDIKVEISGHTDNVGSAEYNKKLSRDRAKAVVDYLIQKGIDKDRMEYAGYGFEKPIADNETEEGRQKNRRTEFKIIANE